MRSACGRVWTMEDDIHLLTNNMVSGGLLEVAAVTTSHSNKVSINNIKDNAISDGQMSCANEPAHNAPNALIDVARIEHGKAKLPSDLDGDMRTTRGYVPI